MIEKSIATQFAPAQRASQTNIQIQNKIFSNNKPLLNLMNSLSQMVVILNKERQIVYANKLYNDFSGISKEELVGMRPGETLACVNSNVSEGGCGTTTFCKKCGAVNSILNSQKGFQSANECRIFTQTKNLIDLQVTSTPYEFEGESYTIFALLDLGNKKRKESLERIFFHDILNSAGVISGLSAVLPEYDNPKEINEIADIIQKASDNLIEEIRAQHQIRAAENGELKLNTLEVNSLTVLEDLKNGYDKHELSANKTIAINKSSENINLNTDPVLLRRVLGNMLKNALEVNNPMAQITLDCSSKNGSTLFSVHNSNYIDPDIQLQLFKHSFSTKGTGRGLGTYSMKLLGERYLKGKVGFESTKEKGTTFYIEL